jgi:hypothetical protein
MHYVTRRSHRMQKYTFDVMCPGSFCVESMSIPPEHEKKCFAISRPELTEMHYVTHKSHQMQKHNFGVICAGDIDDDRYPFCSLTVVDLDHGNLAMGRWLSWFVETAGAAPDVASALAVVAMMGGPPPSSSLTQEAMIQWVNNVSSSGYGS